MEDHITNEKLLVPGNGVKMFNCFLFVDLFTKNNAK